MRSSFTMTIGTDPGEVAGVSAAFAEFADAHAVPAPIRRSVSVALDEFLNNTIAYGFAEGEGRGGGGVVSIAVELGADRLCVTLTDNGKAFNPLEMSAPDTALPVAERQIGGLGIHLARQMMDEVVYQRRADRNVVSLTKLLAGGSPAGRGGGPSMDITTRTQNGVTLVVFAGSLDSNTSPKAQQTLEGILASGARKLAVDCTALDYISSAGLRVLLGTAKRLSGAGGAGGALRLFGLNQTVREVFDISGFSTILAVFATEADALRGF
jgi:anti-anti-sigma factor